MPLGLELARVGVLAFIVCAGTCVMLELIWAGLSLLFWSTEDLAMLGLEFARVELAVVLSFEMCAGACSLLELIWANPSLLSLILLSIG